jgi:hypothetical protein
MLFLQKNFQHLFVYLFGIDTSDPEIWLRLTHPHNEWDGTNKLLET